MDALKYQDEMNSSSTLIALGNDVLKLLETADSAQVLERQQLKSLRVLDRAEKLHALWRSLRDDPHTR